MVKSYHIPLRFTRCKCIKFTKNFKAPKGGSILQKLTFTIEPVRATIIEEAFQYPTRLGRPLGRLFFMHCQRTGLYPE